MAGLYEIWRDPTKADDDPDRFRWTTTVLTTSAEDSLGHIHDRMPLMLEPDAYDAWLDPTSHDRDRLLGLLMPGRAGPARGVPGADPGQQRAEQRTRAGRAAAAVRGPGRGGRPGAGRRRCLSPRSGCSPTPQGDARVIIRRARPARLALLLQHGANGGIGARDLVALATRLPGHGITTIVLAAAVRRRRQAGRARGRPCSTSALAAVVQAAPAAHPAGARRPQLRGPVLVPDGARARRRGRAGARVPAAPARPAGEVPRRRAARRRGADAGAPGHA